MLDPTEEVAVLYRLLCFEQIIETDRFRKNPFSLETDWKN